MDTLRIELKAGLSVVSMLAHWVAKIRSTVQYGDERQSVLDEE